MTARDIGLKKPHASKNLVISSPDASQHFSANFRRSLRALLSLLLPDVFSMGSLRNSLKSVG